MWDMMTGSVTEMERAYERSWWYDRYFIEQNEEDDDGLEEDD
jgi:hypothetical protein